jgi:nucleoside phosphorylase
MTHKADVLIVTVTKVESSAVIQACEQATGMKAVAKKIEGCTYFNLGTLGNAQVFLTRSEMGYGGLGASLSTVYKGIEALSPTAIIMVGIAFGVDEKAQSIGDILVAKQLRPYELQGVRQTRTDLRGDKPHATDWLINHFQMADLQWDGSEVRFGVVLTGEKLVDNTDYRELLLSYEPEAIGGEMEGNGLYVACQEKKVDWILVKSICDWADGNKKKNKESRQKIAAKNATAFVIHALEFGSIDWKQLRGTRSQRHELPEVKTDPSIVKPDFIGRENAIIDLQDRVIKGEKIIVIQAAGGIGKTTLAEQYFCTQGYGLVRLDMAKETNNITPAGEIVKQLLIRYNFQESQTLEFEQNLSILSEKLKEDRSQKIGILIDNLEAALNYDGRFINEHSRYKQLLKVLADSSVLTLITSREMLNETILKTGKYPLKGLSLDAWQKFFQGLKSEVYPTVEIQIDSKLLKNINNAYGGNAKAMEIIGGEILESFKGNSNQFWQENQERLLRHPELEFLVKSQFDRLKESNFYAYQLLCRLGCYRYQNIPTLPEKGLSFLLWDIPAEVDRIKIIDSLRSRFLVERKGNEYFLHPAIRAQAIKEVESNQEVWKEVNIKVAEFYCENANDVIKANQDPVIANFEAITHYDEVGEFEKCHQTLLHILETEENLENLRCSEKLWLHLVKIIEICENLTDNNKLAGLDKAINLIPLGVLYPEIGKNNKAVDVSQRILGIIKSIAQNDSNNKKIIFAQISAHLIAGRANRIIGNFPEALNACKAASKSVKDARGKIDKSILTYWEALSTYELGVVYLEIAKINESFSKKSFLEAWKALNCIVNSAFLAIGAKIPGEIYKFLNEPEEVSSDTEIKVIDEMEDFVKMIDGEKPDKSRDNDSTKKFRILHNSGKCLNLMNFTSLGRNVLNLALKKFVPEQDNLNKTWSYLELALCSLTDNEAEDYYRQSLENFNGLESFCKAYILFEYGSFKHKQDLCLQAIEEYFKLETLLADTEFESLKARNYYSICLSFSKLNAEEKTLVKGKMIEGNIFIYLRKSREICQKLHLPYMDKIEKLNKILSPSFGES